MVNYKALGYNSLEEYFEDFRSSLLKTTHTYDFFVDWKKVEANAKEHIVELGLLNSLTLVKDREECKKLLRKLLKEHPKIIAVIPILLAIRDKSVEVAELTEQIVNKQFRFDQKHITDAQLDDMLNFCEKTGIIDLFGKIKDVYTYVFGVEVGLDTNARKNRAGEVFSRLIEHVISTAVKKLMKSGISVSYRKEVELGKVGIHYPGQKKVDFLISITNKPLIVCEVNIYHDPGSKPNEIVRAYIRLHNLLKERGLTFFWFTDGPGWLKMWKQFKEGANNIDYIMNYTIASRNLEKLLLYLINRR